MFKQELLSIRNDLNKHHRDKSKLLEYYINTRLNKTIDAYYSDIMDNYNYLNKKLHFLVYKYLQNPHTPAQWDCSGGTNYGKDQ